MATRGDKNARREIVDHPCKFLVKVLSEVDFWNRITHLLVSASSPKFWSGTLTIVAKLCLVVRVIRWRLSVWETPELSPHFIPGQSGGIELINGVTHFDPLPEAASVSDWLELVGEEGGWRAIIPRDLQPGWINQLAAKIRHEIRCK